MFGIDCLGCGIQRSFSLVLKGEFIEAFKMYPAIYTLLILAAIILLNFKFRFKNGRKIILTLVILNAIIIVTSYIIKMNTILNHV